jgi:hypothetical protein
MQHVLYRIRSLILAEEHRRFVRIEQERLRADRILLPRAVEALNGRSIVAAVDPAIVRTESERGQTWVLLYCLDGCPHPIHIDTVDDSVHDCL